MTEVPPRPIDDDDNLAIEAPLGVRLAAFTEQQRRLNTPFPAEYDTLVERLATGRLADDAPRVGDPIPAFLLPGPDGRLVDMADLISQGPLVLSFNRGHWCPYCRIELDALASAHAEFADLGVTVASIMPERAEYTALVRDRLRGRILVLSDIGNGYALQVGLVMWVGEPVRDLMIQAGLHLEVFQGSDDWMLPLPATFVIDRSGLVAARFVDPDFRRRMEVDEILRVVRTL